MKFHIASGQRGTEGEGDDNRVLTGKTFLQEGLFYRQETKGKAARSVKRRNVIKEDMNAR